MNAKATPVTEVTVPICSMTIRATAQIPAFTGIIATWTLTSASISLANKANAEIWKAATSACV